MEHDCIFCKIIEGKAPCTKIFENDLVVAFLDIFPITAGHTLVVPKEHSKNILELSEKPMEEIFKAIQKVGAAQMKALGAGGFNVLQSNNPAAGQVVFHTHFHVVPRKDGDGLNLRWPSGSMPQKELEKMQVHLKKFCKNISKKIKLQTALE